jgi:sigma-E factor negative regulatory protein RseA
MSDHKERLEQSLSALMDGEATEMETHRLLKAAAEDPQLRERWKRYHMASSTIKGEPATTSVDYSAAISAAIEQEPAHRTSGLAVFAGSAGRFAIAASVALVAVFGVQQLNSPTGLIESGGEISEFAGVENPAENSGPAIQFPSGFQPAINARTVSVGGNNKSSQRPIPALEFQQQAQQQIKQQYSEAELRAYLNNVMSKHSSHAALNSNQGMLPFARLSEVGSKEGSEKAVEAPSGKE